MDQLPLSENAPEELIAARKPPVQLLGRHHDGFNRHAARGVRDERSNRHPSFDEPLGGLLNYQQIDVVVIRWLSLHM